jgi:WD40 repeat protein
MTTFGRLRSAVRGRRLPAAGAFLFLGYLFANNLPPEARYSVRTEAKVNRVVGIRWGELPLPWTAAEHVSDDGRRVVVGSYDGGRIRLEAWDARTRANQTPAHWKEPEWLRLLGDRSEAGLAKLFADPGGREFLEDPTAWDHLHQRLAADGAPDNIRLTRYRGGLSKSPASDGLAFSPDGRFIAYPHPQGRSLPVVQWALAGGPVVEEARTGRRLTTFPAGVSRVLVAPGGRTAISGSLPTGEWRDAFILAYEEDDSKRPTDRPYLSLWDLETRTRRAELLLPYRPFHVEYDPDGRYVFAVTRSNLVRWWDAESGRPVGDLYCPNQPSFLDGGRVLVGVFDDGRELQFWDAATGRELVSWEPDWPKCGRLVGRLDIPDGRHVFAEFDPHDTRDTGPPVPVVDKFVEWLSDRVPDGPTARHRRQIIVLDAIDRRTLGQVPGVSAAVSPNGRWLAAVDADGVVRVWELPVGRPWARGFAYAAAVFAGGWVVVGLPRRLRRPAASAADKSPGGAADGSQG